MRALGILGGLGPQATASFYLRLLDRLACLGDRRPKLLMCSVGIDLRLERAHVAGTLSDALPYERSIREGLTSLLNAGSQGVAVPCFSLHPVVVHCATAMGLRIISPFPRIATALSKRRTGRVCVLSVHPSEALRRLVSDGGKYPLTRIGFPDSQQVAALREIAVSVIQGVSPGSLAPRLRAVLDRFPTDGETTALLACSELSVVPRSSGCAPVDLTDALLMACVEWIAGENVSNNRIDDER